MPRPVEDRSDVGGAAQFTNIGPVPLSRSGPVPLSRSAFPLPSRFPAPIPKDVAVSGYVWEVENQRLRKPNPGSNTGRERTSSTRESFGVHHPQPTRWV